MDIGLLIQEIKNLLHSTFSTIDLWFDKEATVRAYRPINDGWTINEILEHIGLTNHFLLILIDKGCNKALQNANKFNLNEMLENYVFHRDSLTEIGLHQSFNWIRPEHMEPKGIMPLNDIRHQLHSQFLQCIHYLTLLKNGEGVLHKTTMSVNNLGKIDVYEYIYFLAQHGQRHITQMCKNETAFLSNNTTITH